MARERVGESEGRSPSDKLDDLRQRLRSLGYLDAGVDRFVLGPARATRRPAAIALLASVRIGALAALLLGPAAAIGLTARLPTLVTGPRDALVVAVYLGAFFGVAVATAAFLASLVVSWLARRSGAARLRRGRRLSRIAGVMVTLASLTYLTLWWQTVIAGVGWSAPMWTASALAIAAAISLLLGHAVTVGSFAVVIAGSGAAGRPAETPKAPLSSWRTSAAAGAVAFGGAALLLTVSAGESHRDPPRAPARLTVVPSGVRVRVVAIDGFDARILDELSAAGRVPALSAAFQGSLARLDSSDAGGGDPARVWTTVATGQPPDIHGVQGLETRRVAGVQGSVPAGERSPFGRAIRGATDLVRLTRPAIASGSERRAKTFWEVAAEAGLRTVVVNWWATWPARSDAGIVLSDRATLRLEHGGELDAELAPAALYDSLKRKWPGIKARAQSAAAALDALAAVDPGARPLLQRSAELDALQIALVSEVATPATDLQVVYLPGLDIAQHALLGSQPVVAAGTPMPADGSTAPAAGTLAARLEALKQYYVALDRLVEPLVTPGTDEVVIVVTGPGRVSAQSGARLAGCGSIIRSGESIAGSVTDVAPTILHALGVPIARDLAGSPLAGLFRQEFAGRYPVRFIASYGPPEPVSAVRQGQPLDQEMIDRLRSLGYVR